MLNKILPSSILVGTVTILQFAVLLITQIFLARVLSPTQFGSFALISSVVMFMHTLGNTQGDRFLIMTKKDAQTKLDCIFTAELIWAMVLILISLSIFPYLMKLLKKEEYTFYAQVFALSILYNPLIKPKALLEKKLSFAKATLPIFFSNITSGALAIYLVYNDFGLWGLILWKMTAFLIEVIILWIIAPYRPKLRFDFKTFLGSFRFSYPIMFAAILAFFCGNIDYYLINYLIDAKIVGFYWLAYQVSHYLLSIRASVNKVIFPVVSQIENADGQKKIFNTMTSVTTVIFLIIIFFILLFTNEIIILTYGEKWLPSAILLKIFSWVILLKAVSSTAIPLLYANGITMSDLEISVFNFLLLPPSIYFLTKYYGALGSASAVLIVSSLSIIYIHQRYVKPFIGIGYISYYSKIFAYFITSLGLLLLIEHLSLSIFSKMLIYIGLVISLFYIFKKDTAFIFRYLKKDA